MCGIVGLTFPSSSSDDRIGAATHAVRRMVATLEHRGPDALTAVVGDGVALGHARLSIVDLAGGTQPMRDPLTGATIVFNGEIFNHVELRARLRDRYPFRTHSDTEVVLAAFLVLGIDCVLEFNGQFAFCIHDPRDGALWFARDRFGKRPLFVTRHEDGIAFASEAKALFASGLVPAALDHVAVWETLHLWAPTDRRSVFEGVESLPPGSIAHLPLGGELRVRRYWSVDFDDRHVDRGLTEEDAIDEIEWLLDDAIRLRLRADVPVAAYLSGGLDSSLICAVAQRHLGGALQTFSLAFEHDRYDERAYQASVAAELGTNHRSVIARDRDIGVLLPQAVVHAENVLIRSAPAPLLELSRLVRESGMKVVLTGEGADEMFGGYDLFKETKVRQFWSREPESDCRPALLERLYPYLALSEAGPRLARQFYAVGLDEPEALDFSHRIRWSNTARVARFFAPDVLRTVDRHRPVDALFETVPDEVRRWRPLARAQYLEVRTLLSQYLLSSQGDRMMMANSVEGRFPFLDHRFAELSARLPDHLKIRGLVEKYILKKVAAPLVPAAVVERAKYPYRAPIAEALTGPSAPEWSRELLGAEAVGRAGVFDPDKVSRLVAKLATGARPSEADNMAIMAIASTQLLADAFVWRPVEPRVPVSSVEVAPS